MIEEEGLSFQELYQIIKSKFIIICIVILLSAILGLIYSEAIATEKFQSQTKIAVIVKSDTEKVDFTYSVRVLYTYRDILQSDSVLKTVETRNGINGNLNITVSNDSLVLTVKYTCTDPNKAQKVLEEIIDESKNLISVTNFTQLLTKDNIQELDPAKPAIKVSPNLIFNIFIFAFIGGIAICGFFITKELLDNTIKNEESLESITKISVLAEIPDRIVNGGSIL